MCTCLILPPLSLSLSHRRDLLTRKCSEGVTSVALSSDATQLFVGKYRAQSQIHGCVAQHAVPRITDTGPFLGCDTPPHSTFPYPADVECLALSLDDLVLAVGGGAKSVHLLHVPTGDLLLSVPYPTIVRGVALCRPLELTVNLAAGGDLTLDNSENMLVVRSETAQPQPLTPEYPHGIIFAPIGISTSILTSVLTESLGVEPLETNLRHRASATSDASLFGGEGGAPFVAVLFIGRICVPSPQAAASMRGEGQQALVTVEDEEGRRQDVALRRGNTVALQDWDSWVEAPGPLVQSVVTALAIGCGGARTTSPRNDLLTEMRAQFYVGSKVVVAIATQIKAQMRRTVLAMGGDAGTVVVASFSTQASAASSKHARPVDDQSLGDANDEDEFGTMLSSTTASLRSHLKDLDSDYGSASKLLDVFELKTPGTVNGVSVSHDGRIVAAGGHGNEVIIVETNLCASNAEVRGKKCEVSQRYKTAETIFGVALSGDGKRVAVRAVHR